MPGSAYVVANYNVYWEFPTATEREAATILPAETGRIAWQKSNDSFFIGIRTGLWIPIGGDMPATKTLIDEVDATTTYIGKALPGSATSAAVWQIQRLTTTGPDLAIEWAASGNYSQVWDNRASLSYS